ncbi:hypothetical protein XM38_020040 [Halomicronema hongdechloris C2206]|uniref:Uncharacterized protein n=1 Tax=Halomicronema hongdechloris C2206 TaxID=1641165 RepID=A0A1Z3HL77_9CYAN|nr:hypothetical protein [Halomicronema hongdechloris]ASC71054.1 hypothetical protein XM38_020040 [Halomicronema hongdechloris C2206]
MTLLTPTHIQALLQEPIPDRQAYGRLMEIYCVVKAGGVRVQIEAASGHLARQQWRLEKTISELSCHHAHHPQIPILRQEVAELRRSVAWRIDFLRTIHPQEEAAVQQHLAAIEAYVAAQGEQLRGACPNNH